MLKILGNSIHWSCFCNRQYTYVWHGLAEWLSSYSCNGIDCYRVLFCVFLFFFYCPFAISNGMRVSVAYLFRYKIEYLRPKISMISKLVQFFRNYIFIWSLRFDCKTRGSQQTLLLETQWTFSQPILCIRNTVGVLWMEKLENIDSVSMPRIQTACFR